MKPLLSVVVPTKNRYKYLKYLIDLIEDFKSNEIELVIQDNSDSNVEIIKFLDEGHYQCVRYFHRSDKLSMSGNSNAAVLNSTGEYVCFIGDDDGVCRNIIECVRWMKANDIEALRSKRTSFVWGDSANKDKLNNTSECVIYDRPKLYYKYLDPMKELKKILKEGFQTIDFIPILYNGIVRRDVLDKVYKSGMTFFPGGSPDISNGVSLSFVTQKLVYVDFPVIISGMSKMTGGGVYNKKGRSLRLEEVDFIDKSVVENWEKDIPRIWAGRLAWPESGIKALRYMRHIELIETVNRNYMYASLAVYYRQHFKLAYKYAPSKVKFLSYLTSIFFVGGIRVVKNKIISSFNSDYYVGRLIARNITDILKAEEFLIENEIAPLTFNNIQASN
jgi:glycosyltransferase involved in cell wall biosynthesis